MGRLSTRTALVAVAFSVTAGACIDVPVVDCGDGHLCPHGYVCFQSTCLSPDQIAACSALAEGDECTSAGERGYCRAGGCVPCHPQATSVATGRDHTCAIDALGFVQCWGRNQLGQASPGGPSFVLDPAVVALPAPAVEVGAGKYFSCARLDDGSVWCWGAGDEGQLGDGLGTSGGPSRVALSDDAVALTVGAGQACAILATDRSVACWGSNRISSYLGTEAPSLVPAILASSGGTQQIVLGHRHACLVDGQGRTACFGANWNGELGVPAPPLKHVTSPQIVSGIPAGALAIAAGGHTSCAVDPGGRLWCWGRGVDGELADAAFANSSTPVATTITDATAVSIGTQGACALERGGAVSCWGNIDEGNGIAELRATPAPARLDGVTALSLHFYHACAIANGNVECWGDDDFGELGRGSRGLAAVPGPVIDLPSSATAIATGAYSVCALADGHVYCWGDNSAGQLGDGSLTTRVRPSPVTLPFADPSGISAGRSHACAWDPGGSAACWGGDTFGELGDSPSPTTDSRRRSSPVAAYEGLGGVQGIAIGGNFSCALVGAGAVYCAGNGTLGQLGNGTTVSSRTPVLTITSGVVALAAGVFHACAIAKTGSVSCWGYDGYGQLGDGGSQDHQSAPVAIALPGPADQVATGTSHTCARVGGAVYCWGEGNKLGLGDDNNRTTPTLVSLPSAAVAVAAGADTSCAELANGDVYCWGEGEDGELANGATENALSPVLVPSLEGATLLANGAGGGCALLGGVFECWGSRALLGDGDNSRSIPAPVSLRCE